MVEKDISLLVAVFQARCMQILEEQSEFNPETIIRDKLKFCEADLLDMNSSESESSDSEKPIITYQIRLEWQAQVPAITEDVQRDVTAALKDMEAITDDEELAECRMRCLVLVGASIAWNIVPLHAWNCCIYEVLSDKKNDFKAFICPCGT